MDVRLVDLFGGELVESFENLIIFAAMFGIHMGQCVLSLKN